MIFIDAFNEVIFKPLLNLLVITVDLIPGGDLGFAIIIVTLVIRFILLPLSYKQAKSQHKLTKLQTEVKRIQKENKNNKQKAAREVMALYKKHKINPLAGFIPLLIQLPIIFGLFRIFMTYLSGQTLEGLYSFVSQPDSINTMFLGVVNLAESSAVLAVLTGLAQFISSKITFAAHKQQKKENTENTNKPDFQNIMRTQMTYIMPLVIAFIAFTFPAGLALYWFTTTIFSAAQQYIINKQLD